MNHFTFAHQPPNLVPPQPLTPTPQYSPEYYLLGPELLQSCINWWAHLPDEGKTLVQSYKHEIDNSLQDIPISYQFISRILRAYSAYKDYMNGDQEPFNIYFKEIRSVIGTSELKAISKEGDLQRTILTQLENLKKLNSILINCPKNTTHIAVYSGITPQFSHFLNKMQLRSIGILPVMISTSLKLETASGFNKGSGMIKIIIPPGCSFPFISVNDIGKSESEYEVLLSVGTKFQLVNKFENGVNSIYELIISFSPEDPHIDIISEIQRYIQWDPSFVTRYIQGRQNGGKNIKNNRLTDSTPLLKAPLLKAPLLKEIIKDVSKAQPKQLKTSTEKPPKPKYKV